MKKYIISTLKLVMIGSLLISCTDDFDEINTNPDDIGSIKIETLFSKATVGVNSSSFVAYYDINRFIRPWMQQHIYRGGNAVDFNEIGANSNGIYGVYYNNVGKYLAHIPVAISKYEDKDRYVYIEKIAKILDVYTAHTVSDTNGNMPYTDAFKAAEGNLTPVYDTQEQLFSTWEAELLDAVTTLSASQSVSQKNYGNADLYYGGDVSKWIKAANTLRVKLAMRLMARNPSVATGIITGILNSGSLMESYQDDWALVSDPDHTSHGNWFNGGGVAFSASKSIMNFLNDNNDPRRPIFFRKSSGGLWAGATASPDEAADEVANPEFDSEVPNDSLVSPVQERLWRSRHNYGNGNGSGSVTFLNVTYAELCFMRAELAQRGITSENAADWYNKGIEASIMTYDKMGMTAQVLDYSTSITLSDDIIAYQNSVTYNPAIGLEQIGTQAYLHLYSSPFEAWSNWKRTDFPMTKTTPSTDTGVLTLEVVVGAGNVLEIPRRAYLQLADEISLNYENQSTSMAQMQSDAEFGGAPSNFWGRIWWDKE